MKKSELIKIIKEEIGKVLKEEDLDNYDAKLADRQAALAKLNKKLKVADITRIFFIHRCIIIFLITCSGIEDLILLKRNSRPCFMNISIPLLLTFVKRIWRL